MNKTLNSIAEGLRAAVGKLKDRTTAAVIVAAGASSRMGGQPKQFIDLDGLPVIVRTLRAYNEADSISSITVVVRDGDRERYLEYKEKYGFTKLNNIVTGGSTRQESVLAGLEAVDSGCSYIAIADGARPLTTSDTIDRVCLAAYRYGAATAAYRARDTIKTSDNRGFVASTVDREILWHAATPQVFALNVYRAAAYYAKDEGFSATDDNALVEHIGYAVKLVECGSDNIKLTEPADLFVCEAILRHRKAEASPDDIQNGNEE